MTKDEMINRVYSWVGAYVSTQRIFYGSGSSHAEFEDLQYKQAKEIVMIIGGSSSTKEKIKSEFDTWGEEKCRREAGLSKT